LEPRGARAYQSQNQLDPMETMREQIRNRLGRELPAALTTVALALAGALALRLDNVDLAAVGALLLLTAPGLAAARLICDDRATRLVYGLALGLAISVLLGLGMIWAPARFDQRTITTLWLGATVALAAAALLWECPALDSRAASGSGRATWIMLGVVAATALALRLVGTARSELMGDEAKVLLWATDLIQGRQDIILLHRKGPAEILVAALQYGLLGRMTAFAGRLPFAWASAVGAVALALLAQELFGWRAGLLAGLIASVDGFLLGFGRVIQYPNLVLCFGVVTVAATWRLVQRGGWRHAVAAAVLLAALALCHWDTLWYVATIVWLLTHAAASGLLAWRRWRRSALFMLGAALVVAVAFYVPYLASPTAGAVSGYLTDRLAGGEFIWRDNLGDLLSYSIIYNAVYYAAIVAAATLAGLWLSGQRSRLGRRWQRWALPAGALLGLAAIVAIDPGHLGRGLAMWAVLCYLAYVALSSGDLSGKLGTVWLLLPLAGYLFAVKKPLLSVYNIVPGVALTAALALDRLLAALRRPAVKRAALAALAVLYALSASYALLVFADVDREYIRTYPASRLGLFWSPYRQELPPNAGVGFAHRAGWEQIGQLYACGALEGAYWSNEEELITHWYTRGAIRCVSAPKYLFLADNVKDVEPNLPDLAAYRQIGRVQGGAASGITVWARQDVAVAAPLACAGSAPSFAALATPNLPTARPRVDVLGGAQVRMNVPLGGLVALRGFSLAAPQAEPGTTAVARVYIEVLTPGRPEANLSIQLTRGGQTYLQQDIVLDCGLLRTEEWAAGHQFITRCGLEIPADLAPGWYQVELDAYLLEWVEGRLVAVSAPLCDLEGRGCAQDLAVGKLQVGAPPPPNPAQPLQVEFDGGLWLWGHDASLLRAGEQDSLTVTLYWQQLGQAADDLTVFVHLTDASGQVVAQHDGQPAAGANPTSTWVNGEWLADRHMLLLPPGLPAGEYTLRAGLYDPATGARLPLTAGGDDVALGSVRVR
jgi:hypothetical protein